MSVRFDPFIHHRKSVRYADWDYRTPGFYFITICTFQRTNLFENAEFVRLAALFWESIPQQKTAQHVRIDGFIVMPNHIHFILYLFEYPADYTPQPPPRKLQRPLPGSIGALVGQYKSLVARAINNLRKSPGEPVWQRGYWDHIIRDEDELNNIRHYIKTNPERWSQDKENLDTLFKKMQYHDQH